MPIYKGSLKDLLGELKQKMGKNATAQKDRMEETDRFVRSKVLPALRELEADIRTERGKGRTVPTAIENTHYLIGATITIEMPRRQQKAYSLVVEDSKLFIHRKQNRETGRELVGTMEEEGEVSQIKQAVLTVLREDLFSDLD